ncbi:MAG: hypothetical protein JW982_08910 [Spirochaetes bacterium]|nr:hypothetical protein [Spirochaetota bacterium]
MNLVKWVVKNVAGHFGMKNAVDRLEAGFKLGESSTIQIPKEVMAVSLDFAARGLLNQFAIQTHLDWIMPYWVNRQYDIASSSYIPATVLSTNMAHRNWTAIGTLGSEREPIVDPTGLLTPWFDGWSVEFWILKNDYLIVPAKSMDMYQYLVKSLPIVVSQSIKKNVRFRIESFAHKNDEEIICDSISLENLESVPVQLSLFVSIRPYNPEGIASINRIEFLEDKNIFLVNGKTGLFLPEKADRIFCSNQKKGDCFSKINSVETAFESECPQGLATAFAEYRFSLDAGESREFEVRALTRPKEMKHVKSASIYQLSYPEMKKAAVTEWEKIIKQGLQIDIPYQKMKNTFYSNKAHLYLFIDDNIITPGPYTYHHEYFRDAAYSITTLDKLGYSNEAEKILLNYPSRQRGDGYFLSQEGEWDSNGQALWTYYQHYLYNRNIDFLKKIYPSAYEGYVWIKKNREKKSGLLPAGYSAEHFGPNDYFYWDNFWSLAGLKGLQSIASILGREKDVNEISKEYGDYEKSVFQSIDKANEKFPFPIIPSSPNRNIDSSLIGSISALFPLRLLNPRDPRITGTLRVIREKYQKDHAFFHRVIHSGYNVYLTAQLAECYLFRRSARVLPIVQWIMNNISRTGTFPEAVHPLTGGGCMGDGHHGWAAADLLSLIRNMIFFEEDGGIVITPVLYHRWMEAGEVIEIRKAASYFGELNIRIESHADRIELNLDMKYFQRPEFIEFSVPFSVKKALAGNTEIFPQNGSRFRFDADVEKIIVFR